MDSLSLTCPCCCFLPLHHRSHFLARAKISQQLYYVTKFPKHRNYRLFHFAAFLTHQALNSSIALAEAASSPAEGGGGDLSVLIPISAVMLSLYWVANFVIPGMITKDLQGQPAASAQDEEPDEQEATGTVEENMGAAQPNRKEEEPTGVKKNTASSTAR